MAEKVDLKRLDAYRAKQGELRIVDVPELQYLMLDGRGDPNGAAFAEALEALYPVAYAMKFASKQDQGRDYDKRLAETGPLLRATGMQGLADILLAEAAHASAVLVWSAGADDGRSDPFPSTGARTAPRRPAPMSST